MHCALAADAAVDNVDLYVDVGVVGYDDVYDDDVDDDDDDQ